MVLVTTENRGVYAGRLVENDAPRRVILEDARVCVSWDTGHRGFLVLAVEGPAGVAEVSPAVGRIEIYGVCTVAECTEEAAEAWREA